PILVGENPDSLAEYEIPGPNFSEINYIRNQQKLFQSKALMFAYNYETDISPKNSGKWKTINKINVWHLKIKAQETFSIGLVFENFKLQPGEKLFLFNANDILGAYTNDNNPKSKVFAVRPIRGNEVIIEFSTPYSATSCGTFTLTTVSLGYLNIFSSTSDDPCNVNINCAEGAGWQKEKRAVAKLIVQRYIGTILCSGTLLNNTRNDGRALMITANHCIENDFNAERTIFVFNFESPACSINYSLRENLLQGAKVLSTKYENDYSLIELNQHPPIAFHPYYAGWSLDSGTNMNTVVTIHHPNGKVKKITQTNSHPISSTYSEEGSPPYATNAFWYIPQYTFGITENGSSGAGLFDLNHQLVGTLTGGNSSDPEICNTDLYDYYQKFSYSYKVQPIIGVPMKDILNPDQLNINQLDGFDPFPNPFTGCDTITNIATNETSESKTHPLGGFYAGYNADSITIFGEKFLNTDSAYLYAVEVNVRNNTLKTGFVTLQIFEGKEFPESLKYEKLIPATKLKSFYLNTIELYPFIRLKGNYFVVIKLPLASSDTFNLAMVRRNTEPFNSMYVYRNNLWESFNQYSGWYASCDIKVMHCASMVSDTPKPVSPVVELFPNPSRGYFYLRYDENIIKNIEIFNLTGQKINIKFEKRNNVYPINLYPYPAGIYLLKTYDNKGKSQIIKIVKL
ncbi:MAG: T9SS type A sorting domain-containing protein, partial [Bacteroidales bacterium]|nr:T9SS type A sorting domain-containing protein [Bacteroidales bacterium]